MGPLLEGDGPAEPARRPGHVLHGLHPDGRRVRHAGPRRRHGRDHVRQHHPGLLHPFGELAGRGRHGDDHAVADAPHRGGRPPPHLPAPGGRVMGLGPTRLPLGWGDGPLPALLGNGPMLAAARNSLVVGVASATVATAMGCFVAIAVLRFRFRGRRLLLAMAGLPLLVPYVVLGVAFFLLFVTIDIPRSLLTVAVGHTVIAIPFATLILLARMSGLDPALEDAAMDLGASYPVAMRRVVLPLIAPTLLSAWLTCFIVSFDEIALAIFLVGGDPTFPVFLYGQLRFAQRLPVLIAMAVLLLIGTLTPTLIALRLRRGGG